MLNDLAKAMKAFDGKKLLFCFVLGFGLFCCCFCILLHWKGDRFLDCVSVLARSLLSVRDGHINSYCNMQSNVLNDLAKV